MQQGGPPAHDRLCRLSPSQSDLAFTLFGEVFVSDDAGESWRKIPREFGEIRTAAWVSN